MFKSVWICDLEYMKHHSRVGIKSQILKTKQPKNGAGTDKNQSPDLTNRVRITGLTDPRTRISEQKLVSERNGALFRFISCLSRGKYGSLKPAGGWGTGSSSQSTAATQAIKKRRRSKRGVA